MVQQRQPLDMAHVLGWFALGGILLAAIGVSAVLSSIFFVSISPPDKPWMVYLFLSLTEVGMVAWLVVFFLMRHHPFHKSVAIIMACVHGLCSFIVAGYELDSLIFGNDVANHGASLSVVGTTLLAIFGLDLVAVFVDVISRYFEKPGHEFRAPTGGNLIPMRENNSHAGNLIPQQRGRQAQMMYSQADMQRMAEQITRQVTGHLVAVIEEREAGETDPLAQRQLPRPRRQKGKPAPIAPQFEQEEENNDPPLLSVETLKWAGSTLMRKLSRSTKSGERAAPAPGEANGTTSGNGSDPLSAPLPPEPEEESDDDLLDQLEFSPETTAYANEILEEEEEL